MTCADDWWDDQLPDFVADENPEDIPDELIGPHLWCRGQWRSIVDAPDIATYQTA